MKIHVLGAHNCESTETRLVSLLIDDTLALDAGGLTSSLSFEAQLGLKAVLLTHAHYDHVRDVPALAINAYLNNTTINIYSGQTVYDALVAHMLNGNLYPNFFEYPQGNPTIKFISFESHQSREIEGYTVLASEVNHSVPALGYQVTSPDGKIVFYTGDTGPGLEECWKAVSPQLLIIELSAPDRFEKAAEKLGHLTPGLLKRELISFRELKGYLPAVALVHINRMLEEEIAAEIEAVAAEFGIPIDLAHEGMELYL